MQTELLSDLTADMIVSTLDSERQRLRSLRTGRDMRGPSHAEYRALLRDREKEMEYAISAINTGKGVTRRSATEGS